MGNWRDKGMIGRWSRYLRNPETHWFEHNVPLQSRVEAITDLVFPILVLAALTSSLFLSNVPPNLLVVKGDLAESVIVAYGLALILSMVQPTCLRIHPIAAALGVFAFAGRAGGFLELILDLGRWDLGAAVIERLVLSVAVLRYHAGRAAKYAIKSEIVNSD